MDEIIAGIAVVVVTVPTWVLPRFIGRLATSPAFFLIFGALQLAVAVAGYALSYYNGWDWWAPSLIAFLGAYDIWRGLKVRGPAQGMKAG